MRTFLLTLLIVVASAAQAVTYYVAPTGSDASAGTALKPWATLQHAVDTIQPGDVILVETGTYVGCRIRVSGTATGPKTLAAVPGAHVLLDAPSSANMDDSIVEIQNPSQAMSNWRIVGFEVAHSPRYGIDVRWTNQVFVASNHVHNCAYSGILTSHANDLSIYGNETDHNGAHGIYCGNSSISIGIQANRTHDNAGCGVYLNGDLSEQPGNGLIQYAVVSGNMIYNNNNTILGGSISCDGVDHSLLMNNLLYNNNGSGIALYGIAGAHSSSNDCVYNNTVVMPVGSRWPITLPDNGYVAPPMGNVVANNILYTPNSSFGSILVAGPKVPGFLCDYNVVVSRMSDYNGNSLLSLAAWQKLGYDVHSLVATPAQLFVNPTLANYQLIAGSPAIDAGAKLPIVTVDILGTPRPQGKGWDIGCYEYKAAAP
jgi:hypothetical protein